MTDMPKLPPMKFGFTSESLTKAGLRYMKIIQDRTLKGEDEKGRPFKAYSTKPAPYPFGKFPKRAFAILKKENGKLVMFRNKSGVLMVTVPGGYAALKKAIYKQTNYDGTVNLTLTGEMLRDMTTLQPPDNKTIVIGFNDAWNAKKALMNAMRGRKFLGLTDKDKQDKIALNALGEGLTLK